MGKKQTLILDGGMATSLEEKGFDLSGSLWSAKLLVENPNAIRDVHIDHARAGADILTSASYQASRHGFAANGYSEDDYLRALEMSLIIAQSAADEIGSREERKIQVAASIGPYGATLADGSEYRGDYIVDEEFLINFHGERLNDIQEFEPDFLAIETVPSIIELRAINHLLNNDFRHLAAWVSCSAPNGSSISDGTPIADAFNAISAPNVIARGINCSKPEYITELLTNAGTHNFVVYPNAGRTWDAQARSWLDDGHLTIPDAEMNSWIDAGVGILGGCCGLGVEHIASVKALLGR
ncbi:MAG: homocysteine S-methyltransferase [Actinomycetota bacterium]|jgi:homocysteine S-methyltransferase